MKQSTTHPRAPGIRGAATRRFVYNLASAATASIDDLPGGCGVNENKDGDHYFCTPSSADLEPVFRQVAAAAIETAHLINT